jgi:hypothetical protein
MEGRRHGWLLAFGAGVLLFGCDKPTSITLRISADQPCSAMKGVRIEAGPEGGPARSQASTDQCRDEAGLAVIGTIVLVPSGDDSATVGVRVVGGLETSVDGCNDEAGFAGCIVARRGIRFVPEKEIDLPIVLRAVCKNVLCDATATCVQGVCQSSQVSDPSRCVGTACDETQLPGPGPGPAADGGVILPDGGAGRACETGEKPCKDQCVTAADPSYGCTRTGCTPCAGSDIADFGCGVDTCLLIQCKTGYKKCSDGCVPADPAHGCDEQACTACPAVGGTATCASGKCDLVCTQGFKLCNGQCVSVDDPNYGCTSTGCTACPVTGQVGSLLCTGGSCVVGSCTGNTKLCNNACVPTNASYGCEETNRCSPCAQGEACTGSPSACACVPEPLNVTCATKACGPAQNNCGQGVTCPNTCAAPNTCGGGSSGPNGCGCTPAPDCASTFCKHEVPDGCGGQYLCQIGSGCQ